MAIIIEFVDLIIPIATIERCEPIGGFQGFLRSEAKWVGSMIWWDEHLCRADGSMTSTDIPTMIERWAKRGLRVYDGEEEKRTFCDLCVVTAGRGPLWPCSWLKFDKAIAWHSAYPAGNSLVGPPQWYCDRLMLGSRLNLLAIRVADLDRARRFYEALGLRFAAERHGKGPEHLATKSLNWVFEIYPRGSGPSTTGVVLGFHVQSLEAAVSAAKQLGAEVVSSAAESPWGLRQWSSIRMDTA